MTDETGATPEPRAEDRELIELIAARYQPVPMSPVREAAFRRSIEAHLDWRARLPSMPTFAIAATAALAAVLWINVPRSGAPDGDGSAVVERTVRAPSLYAFVEGDTDDFLPDDYVVLAGALDVPVDDF